MKIAFCYDLVNNHPGNSREDSGAEYESPETIDALASALEELGRVIRLPYHPDVFLDLREHRPDVVFNITESYGSRNRESFVPNICEMLDIPYTGSDGLAMGLSLDKALAKDIARANGVPTPDSFVVRKAADLDLFDLDYPLFIKPNHEGSSMGIRRDSLIESPDELVKRVEGHLANYAQPVLIEEFLPGREFGIAVLGNKKLRFFPAAEVLPGGGEHSFYSYEYKGAHDKKLECPADIPSELEGEMFTYTERIFRALGCRDLARVDYKMSAEGIPQFMEINPLPGLSPYYSLYPHQVEVGGIGHGELIRTLVGFALERKGKVMADV